MRLYTKEYRVVKRPFARYALSSEIKDPYNDLKDQEYEVDTPNGKSSKSSKDDYVQPFLDDSRDIEVIRKEKRKCLVLFPPPNQIPSVPLTRAVLLSWKIGQIYLCAIQWSTHKIRSTNVQVESLSQKLCTHVCLLHLLVLLAIDGEI